MTMTNKGERQTLTERKPAKGIRVWSRTSGFWREVDPVKKSSEFTPLHPILRSNLLGNQTVCERFHFR